MRLALLLGFAATCTAMHTLAGGLNWATAEGLPVLAYNLLSLPLLCLFAASCYCAGTLVVLPQTVRTRLDLFLLRSVCGFCLLSLAGYVVAFAGGLFFPVALSTLGLPLLLFPCDSLGRLPVSTIERCALALFALLLVYLLCLSGVLYLYVENDFAHYFPALKEMLAQGSNRPNAYLWASFYIRGSGTSLLLAAVSSLFSLQLISLYALAILALLTYRLCSMMSSSVLAALGVALLLFASKAMKIESYKGHAMVSMLLLAVPYFMVRLYLAPRQRRLVAALVLLLCSIVVVSPPAAVFLALPIAGFLGASLLVGKKRLRTAAALCAIGPAATFLLVLLLNLQTTGVLETTPPALTMLFHNTDKIAQWVPVPAFVLLVLESSSSGFSFPAAKLGMLSLQLLGCAGALVGLCSLSRTASRRTSCLRVAIVLFPVLSLGLACPFLSVVTEQRSFSRFIVFYSAVQPLYLAAFLLCAIPVGRQLLNMVVRVPWTGRQILSAVFMCTALYALIFNWTPKWSHQVAHAKAFFGATSLRPVLGHWVSPEVERLDASLPPGVRVMPLYYAHYAYFYDDGRFVRPLMNRDVRELPVLLGTDASAAIAGYRRSGIRHFLVNLDPLEPMAYEAFGDVFDSTNVARYFRVRELGSSIWLLTLEGSDQDGAVPDEGFRVAYADKRRMEIGNPRNLSYLTLERARRELPLLSRPPWRESGARQ